MLGSELDAAAYFDRFVEELRRVDVSEVEDLSALIERAYRDGRTVFVIGNGGSGANASHLCEDLNKCTLRDFDSQRRLRVHSLTDNTPAILAWANDEGYDRIFVEQLRTYAEPGDLLLAISGSGNSPNILRAVEWANAHGVDTVGITGYSGGQLKALARHSLHVPLDDMGTVESIHQVAFHWVIGDLYRRISLSVKAAAAADAAERS